MSFNHPASFFDGNIDSWFHYECFWKNMTRGKDEINIASIRGVDWLKWEDQEDLRARVKKWSEPYVPGRSPVFVNDISLSALKAEKSATNRGKCAKCETNFQKGEIKVSHKSKFQHLKCHLETFEKILGNLEDIDGWADFDECWRVNAAKDFAEILEKIKATNSEQSDETSGVSTQPELSREPKETDRAETGLDDMDFNGVLPTASIGSSNRDDDGMNGFEVSSHDIPSSSTNNKRAAEDDIVDVDANINGEESAFNRNRRLRKEARMAEKKEEDMKKQANQLFQNMELFNSMSSSDRLTILSENGQELKEEHDNSTLAVERLSDFALFGCPLDCLKCGGRIIYNSSRRTYICNGYATEYSKCTFETKNPIRTPFVMPKRLCQKYKIKEVIFNMMSERLYREGEESEIVVKTDKRKSRGGVHGANFVYAAEQIDLAQNGVVIKSTDTAVSSQHIIKNGTLVDVKFRYAKDCHVLKNETDGSLYQAALSFTDLTQNKNSYYKIQLLKHDIIDDYYLFRSWGRVGTDVGDCSYENFTEKEDGVASFEELFSEKTKNEWKYRKYFRKMPGSFSYVETDFSEFAALENSDIIPGSKTLLPRSVKEVLMSIFDVENMKTALKSYEMDVNKMPLGRLSKNQINLAFGVLNDLTTLLAETPPDNEKILDATNKFYTIIPHNFGMKVPDPIDNLHKVKEKNNMLNALLDIKFAYDQICGGNEPSVSTIGIDPVDTNYRKLKCIMTPLEKDCHDWKLIHEYLKNTKGTTHDLKVDLVDILKLDREHESTKFKRHIGNRRLLWHGSGKMNFAGILGQGLRIAPPEAPVSGYMFGKGVYFADMFSKSFFYCRAQAKDEAYLLLCDVALGTIQTCMHATTYSKKTLPKQTHSVQGIGREGPQDSGNYDHPDGYMIPKGASHIKLQGDLHTHFNLLYNEYIVYDVDQIQLKYLVRVKVHHARHR